MAGGGPVRTRPRVWPGSPRVRTPGRRRSVRCMTRAPGAYRARHVVIAGSGVAGLEAALGLSGLGGDRPRITMITPDSEFTYRPMGVREPFGLAGARRYPLNEIARDLGLELHHDRVVAVQPEAHTLRTAAGSFLAYDTLLLAVGPLRSSVFANTLSLDDHRLGRQLARLRVGIERDEVESVAFIAPRGTTWPLPIYELALLTAAHADALDIDLSITVATPETAPLASFGPKASAAVRGMLHRAGISLQTSARCHVDDAGRLVAQPRAGAMYVDLIVATPLLWGPSIPGIPSGPGGFVPVDRLSRVRGLDDVFAAGDMTDLPIKHGGLAAQQADVASQMIAAELGAGAEPRPHPLIVEAILLGADGSVRLRGALEGEVARCAVSHAPYGVPRDKLITRRLSPYLRRLDDAGAQPPPVDPPGVQASIR